MPATAREFDEDSLKAVSSGDYLELWLEDVSDRRLNSLVSLLREWSFWPDYKTRPATDAEIRGVEDEFPAIADRMRRQGLAVYESPVRIPRGGDEVEGRAFDDLRVELGRAGDVVSIGQLRDILQDVRLRNLPAGTPAHSYFF
jgi:hypothetical protein